MSVLAGLQEVAAGPSVVALGVFDGVHVGHQAMLRRAVAAAERSGVRSVAVTFDPHPRSVVRPADEPRLLQPLNDRTARLDELVDDVLVLRFTDAVARQTPREFAEHVLFGRLQTRVAVVGENFRFGHRAAGDVALLAELAAERDASVQAVPLHTLDGAPLSSSRIRQHVAAGDVTWADRALGRPFELVGQVVRGDGRGRGIGFPTANVAAATELQRPGGGVYAGRACPDEAHDGPAWHPCVVNVGTRPTFEGAGVTVEAHLLDTRVDLYGRTLRVRFLERLRDERRFDGVDALVAQLERDVASARALLSA